MKTKLNPGFASNGQLRFLAAIGLFVLTAAVYWPVHRFGFILYDDPGYVERNRHVQQGISAGTLRFAFTTTTMSNYHPLTWISYLIDENLFRLRPGAMHAENVVLHIVSGILLWILLTTLTGRIVRSFFVAGLFLCHPMHVESVAWISERKDVLSTPLLLGAMLAYTAYYRSAAMKWWWYALLLILYLSSLLTKPMGVTLPALLLLLDYWPLRRLERFSWSDRSLPRLIAEKIPLLMITAAAAIATAIAQQTAMSSINTIGIADRIGNALVCYVIYILKLAVPIDLAVFYPYPHSRPLAQSLAAVGLLALMIYFAVRYRARKPYFIVGLLFFLISLVPVIGLVQIGGQAMADRYSYFPSIGLFVAIVWGIGDLLTSLFRSSVIEDILWSTVIVIFSVLARRQVEYWKDTRTLFTHTLHVTDENWLAHMSLGNAAYADGDAHTAFEEFTLADQDKPNDPTILEGLGNCWAYDDPNRAITYYQHAVALDSANPDLHENLADALRKAGDLVAAERELRLVLSIDPESTDARQKLAHLMAEAKPVQCPENKGSHG